MTYCDVCGRPGVYGTCRVCTGRAFSPTTAFLAARAALRSVPPLAAHMLGWMNPTGREHAETTALRYVLDDLGDAP